MADRWRNGLKWMKRHWIITTLLVLVVGGGLVFAFTRGEEEPMYITETVERMDLRQTVDVTGEIVAQKEANLAFVLSGKVERIAVREGQTVAENELLMVLDTTDLEFGVERAQRGLQISLAQLAQQEAGITVQRADVLAAQADVALASLEASNTAWNNTQRDLEQVQRTTLASVRQAEESVQSAEEALENTLSNTGNDTRWIDLTPLLQSTVGEVRQALLVADSILGVDQVSLNDAFEDDLAARDSMTLIYAQNAYVEASHALDRAMAQVNRLSSFSGETEVRAAGDVVAEAVADATNALNQTQRVLSATDATDTLPASQLLSLRQQVETAQARLTQAEQARLSAISGASQGDDSTSTARIAAESRLREAQAALDRAVFEAERAVAAAEAQVASARASYEIQLQQYEQTLAQVREAQASPRPIDTATLRADVARARTEVEAARAKLADATLRAPFSGVITEVSVEEGELALSGSPVMTLQTTNEVLRAEVIVSESDIAKITTGDEVEVTFDALGSDAVVKGKVGRINPAEARIEGVVYYEATLDLEELPEEARPGMTLEATVLTANAPNALVVPQRAVLREDGVYVVRVLEDGDVHEQIVEIGLRGDRGLIEIKNGLQEGQTIVLAERN